MDLMAIGPSRLDGEGSRGSDSFMLYCIRHFFWKGPVLESHPSPSDVVPITSTYLHVPKKKLEKRPGPLFWVVQIVQHKRQTRPTQKVDASRKNGGHVWYYLQARPHVQTDASPVGSKLACKFDGRVQVLLIGRTEHAYSVKQARPWKKVDIV